QSSAGVQLARLLGRARVERQHHGKGKKEDEPIQEILLFILSSCGSRRSLRRVVVDNLPARRRFPDYQGKPPRGDASASGCSLQIVLPGSQGQVRGERPNVDLRESERSHGLAVGVAPAIAAKYRVRSAPDNLIADEGGFGRVLVVRHERHQIAAV